MKRSIKISILFILGVVISFGVFIYLASSTPLFLLMPANVKFKVFLAKYPQISGNKKCGINCQFHQFGTIAKAFFVRESKIAETLKDKSMTPEERETTLILVFTLKKEFQNAGGGNMFSKEDIKALCKAGENKKETTSLRKQILEMLADINAAKNNQKVVNLEMKIAEDKTEDLELRRIAIRNLTLYKGATGKELPDEAINIFARAIQDNNLCSVAEEGLLNMKDKKRYKDFLKIASDNNYSFLARKDALSVVKELVKGDNSLINELKDPQTINILNSLLTDSRYGVRFEAAMILKDITGKEYSIEDGPKQELSASCTDQFITSIDTGEIEIPKEEQQKIIEENKSMMAEPTEEEKELSRKKESGELERESQEEAKENWRIFRDKTQPVDQRLKAFSGFYGITIMEERDSKVDDLCNMIIDKSEPLTLRDELLVTLIAWTKNLAQTQEEKENENKIFAMLEKIANDEEENQEMREAAIIRKVLPDGAYNWLQQKGVEDYYYKKVIYPDQYIYELDSSIKVMEEYLAEEQTKKENNEDFDSKMIEEITSYLNQLEKYSK